MIHTDLSSPRTSAVASSKPAVYQRRNRLAAAALATLTLVVLVSSAPRIGYVRDEGIYFEASRHYGAWISEVLHDPAKVFDARSRDRAFRINHEHPALMKMAAGISARLLARPSNVAHKASDKRVPADPGGLIPVMDEGAAMRLPAQMLAGFGVFLLFLAGRRLGRGTLAGLLAAGWFILLPRVVFNASLHTFDVPIAVATLMVVLAYRRSLESARWGLMLGPILGIAIAIKHNALFVGVLLALHYLACLILGRFRGNPIRRGQWIPLPLLSMATLAPITAIALWPWLWHDTFTRIAKYFAFHSEHSYYNMEFMAVNYNRPPLPWTYSAVMTWATVPTVLLVLSLFGLGIAVVNDFCKSAPERDRAATLPGVEARWFRPLPARWPHGEGILLLLFSSFPLVLIALPSVPIFGGTKHWLTAYPFLALAAAVAWSRLWSTRSLRGVWRGAPACALVWVLGPGCWSSLHGHPYNLSQYSPLVGGARGAASLGLNRGFWGHAVVGLMNQDFVGSIYLHDIHPLAVRQYQREGRWPQWKGASVKRSHAGLLFHELHTTSERTQLWQTLGTTAPDAIIALDDVPLTSLYRRTP